MYVSRKLVTIKKKAIDSLRNPKKHVRQISPKIVNIFKTMYAILKFFWCRISEKLL